MKWSIRIIALGFIAALVFGFSRIWVPPILVYSGRVKPEVFSRQMEFLKSHRYRVLSMETLAEKIRTGRSIPRKSVVITFDGGLRELYESSYHTLQRMDYPALVYIHANAIGYPGFLKASQIRELLRNGIDIGSNGLSGLTFEGKPQAEARTEIFGSKRSLENLLTYPVNHFSYPLGYFDSSSKELVEEAGYLSAVTLDSEWELSPGRFRLQRIVIEDNDANLLRFWLKISGFYGLKNVFKGTS